MRSISRALNFHWEISLYLIWIIQNRVSQQAYNECNDTLFIDLYAIAYAYLCLSIPIALYIYLAMLI